MASMDSDSVDAIVSDPPYFLTSIAKRFGGDKSAPAQFAEDGSFARLSSGFMNAKWDSPEVPPIDPAFAHWFAGFVDGEGCFSVHKKSVNNCETYDCQFSISLRADDLPILEEIKRQLGGIGSLASAHRKAKGMEKPQSRYCISSKADCQRLRAVFQVFPLRAKKRRDFEIWCDALDAWVVHKIGGGWDDMSYFRDSLMAVRNFGSVHRPERLFFYRVGREMLRILKPGGHIVMFNGTRTYHHMVCGLEDAGFEVRDQMAWLYGSGFTKKGYIRDSNGDMVEKGWAGQIKPAQEPILLARKPLSEPSVALNMKRWGVGALNIDGCRVEYENDADKPKPVFGGRKGVAHDGKYGHSDDYMSTVSEIGRWPANIIHDGSPEVLALLGSVARFFYTAKADKLDRIGSKHPTVKPVDLMQWLCRLVTPPGGIVLDPFAGSGSTGEAAWREGFRAVLIEREEEYQADIAARLALADKGPRERKARAIKQGASAGPLFGDNDNAAGGGQSHIREVRGSTAGIRPEVKAA